MQLRHATTASEKAFKRQISLSAVKSCSAESSSARSNSAQRSRLPRHTHSEVVPKQLHDQSAVFVRLFIQRVQLCYRFIKCLKPSKTKHLHALLSIRFCLRGAHRFATLLFRFCHRSFHYFSFPPSEEMETKVSTRSLTNQWEHRSLQGGSRLKPRTTALPQISGPAEASALCHTEEWLSQLKRAFQNNTEKQCFH